MIATLLVFSGLTAVHGATATYNCSYYDSTCDKNQTISSSSFHTSFCKTGVAVCEVWGEGLYGPEDLFCYASLKPHNNRANFVIAQKGCFYGREGCQNSYCEHSPYGRDHDYDHCCCRGNMCNLHPFQLVPTSSQTPERPTLTASQSSVAQSVWGDPSSDSQTSGLTGEDSKTVIVVLIAATIGSVVVIAAAFVSAFWCWSQRHRDELEIDHGLEREMEWLPSGTPGPEIDLSSLTLIQKIGSGRFSDVWKARLKDDYVAVKIFPEHQERSWNTERKLYMKANIKHDCLGGFVATERHLDRGNTVSFWMILDFHELGSLNDFLKTHVLALDDLCKMAGSVAAGLAYLHCEILDEMKPSIAHRDLKSKNILMKTNGTCCICDLGLSISFQPGKSLTEAQGQVGTVRYMAPEVLEGAITFNRESFLRIDVYALGLVIWEMMSRCTALGQANDYKQPFEEEVGLHPNIEQMKDAVVTSRVRPRIPRGWDCVQLLEPLVETVEECWDHDAESRLTAQCVEERANWCLKFNRGQFSPSNELGLLSNPMELSRCRNDTVIVYHQESKGESWEQTGEPDMPAVPFCNGHVQSSQAVCWQSHPSGIDGLRQTQQPIAFLPPCSAVLLSAENPI